MLALRLRANEHLSDITVIRASNGCILSDPMQVNTTFHSFYVDLYSSEVVHDRSTCDDLLGNIQFPKLSEEDSSSLKVPITIEELRGAAQAMRRGKSPRLDGIPPEFYTTF